MKSKFLLIFAAAVFAGESSFAVTVKFKGSGANRVDKNSVAALVATLEKLSAKGERDIQVELNSDGGD
ncbi:MAG: hypothetical protein V4692_13550, partial [Bdellovibrionota bacterium]